MKLYHGSTVEVREPKILTLVNCLDFGAAFYITSSFNQALSWSKTKAHRRKIGRPTVSIYEFDERNAFQTLKVKEFFEPTEEWLDFVVAQRSRRYRGEKFDLIIGPVADDQAITVLDKHIAGQYPPKMALELLEPQNLVVQYAFTTIKALSYLKCIGVENGGVNEWMLIN